MKSCTNLIGNSSHSARLQPIGKERVDGYPKADAKKTSQMQPNLHLKLAMSQKISRQKHDERAVMCISQHIVLFRFIAVESECTLCV